MTARELLRNSSVTSKANSDILTFSVESEDRALATRLATAYARGYTDFRRRLDTSAIERARSEAKARLNQLEASGQGGSALYANLDEKLQLLNTMAALQTSNAFLVEPADRASQISPQLVRTVLLALTLSLILGVGLAFLFETLDTRVRSADEIATRLGLPQLARIPAPRRKLSKKNGLVTLEEPNSAECRGVPDPADEPRVRRSRPAGEDDHGDLRGRG